MKPSLTVTIGSCMSVTGRAGAHKVTLEVGDDYEGGLLATAKLIRCYSAMGRSDEATVLGIHAANGKHARWVWFGVAGQRQVRGWRIAWWLPKRRDRRAEVPPLLEDA